MSRRLSVIVFALLVASCSPSDSIPGDTSVRTIQLNWLHDPTFAGEYMLVRDNNHNKIRILEGGPNVFPIAEVRSGRADVAIVGADIFLKAADDDIRKSGRSSLAVIFADFQRNPVGWILHPSVADRLGITEAIRAQMSSRELNNWLFEQLRSGRLQIGDKRGTETTAIWLAWAKKHGVSGEISPIPVGFDSDVVLSAPALAYPVYLNEEPFRLAGKLGHRFVLFDPSADGIEEYGNVVVARTSYVKRHPKAIKAFQLKLSEAWHRSQTDKVVAVKVIMKYYTGVPQPIVASELNKTLEFVYYHNPSQAGIMDLAPNGRWTQTLKQLKMAGAISEKLTLNELRPYVISP